MSETTCPVFRPSMEEFQDFRSYMNKIQSAAPIGICKIIPPAGWFRRTYDVSSLSATLPRLTATRQVITGHSGVYDVNMFEVPNMTISALKDFASQNCCNEQSPADLERFFWKSLVRLCPSHASLFCLILSLYYSLLKGSHTGLGPPFVWSRYTRLILRRKACLWMEHRQVGFSSSSAW